MAALAPCHDCRALVPAIAGPTHRYLGASPGCWAIYGEIGARSMSDPAYRRHHQIVVDTYAVQHPGAPSPQAIQSVAVHLLGLHAQLVLGFPSEHSHAVMERALRRRGAYHWLAPPSFEGTHNVLHVRDASSADDYARRGEAWARSVWRAWRPHHATVAAWYEREVAGSSPPPGR